MLTSLYPTRTAIFQSELAASLEGIDANRMTTRGYGSTRPTASNDTEEGRAQNRRIEFRRTDSGAAEEGQPAPRPN